MGDLAGSLMSSLGGVSMWVLKVLCVEVVCMGCMWCMWCALSMLNIWCIWCVYGVVRVECVGEGQQRRFRGEHFLVFTSGYSNGSISWHKVPFSSSSPWVQLPTGWGNSAI